MGEGIITRKGCGAVKAFALIGVEYTPGWYCALADSTGSTLLARAADSSGRWIFPVTEAGSYHVVSAPTLSPDDPDMTAAAVEISSKGQLESVSLARTYLYSAGDEYTGLTGGWYGVSSYGESDSQSSASLESDSIRFESGSGVTSIHTGYLISKGQHTRLCVEVTEFSASGDGSGNIMLSTGDGDTETGILAEKAFTEKGVHTVDLSGVTEAFYLTLYTYSTAAMTVAAVWME